MGVDIHVRVEVLRDGEPRRLGACTVEVSVGSQKTSTRHVHETNWHEVELADIPVDIYPEANDFDVFCFFGVYQSDDVKPSALARRGEPIDTSTNLWVFNPYPELFTHGLLSEFVAADWSGIEQTGLCRWVHALARSPWTEAQGGPDRVRIVIGFDG